MTRDRSVRDACARSAYSRLRRLGSESRPPAADLFRLAWMVLEPLVDDPTDANTHRTTRLVRADAFVEAAEAVAPVHSNDCRQIRQLLVGANGGTALPGTGDRN